MIKVFKKVLETVVTLEVITVSEEIKALVNIIY
jgi:hypothetical protein